MRRSVAVLAVVLAPALVAGAEEAPRRTRPTIEGLGRQIQASEARLLRLVARAGEDPRITRIDRYLAMVEPPRRGAKRETTIKDLLGFLSDPAVPTEVREKAREALKDPRARSLDPELAVGRDGKRMPFSRDQLVPLLASKDLFTRRAVHEVLSVWWLPSEPAILRYDPDSPATWRDAQSAWQRFLRTR